MMDGWGGAMGAGGWTLMIIFWVALIVLIGLAIVRLFPSSFDGGAARGDSADRSPERVLDERLARGQIDIETYERLREVLAGRARRG